MEKELSFHTEEISEAEIIRPPRDWYFVHGVKNWSKKNRVGIVSPEISGSVDSVMNQDT